MRCDTVSTKYIVKSVGAKRMHLQTDAGQTGVGAWTAAVREINGALEESLADNNGWERQKGQAKVRHEHGREMNQQLVRSSVAAILLKSFGT